MAGGYGLSLEQIAELTDAEIADIITHQVPSMEIADGKPAWTGGDDSRSILSGSDELDAVELTPEEEVEAFLAAGQSMGLSPQEMEKARAYAEDQLRKHREKHGRSTSN